MADLFIGLLVGFSGGIIFGVVVSGVLAMDKEQEQGE